MTMTTDKRAAEREEFANLGQVKMFIDNNGAA